MTFKSGVSGNPAGKPRGTISKNSKLRELLIPHAEELINTLITLAKNGDTNALRLCIERLIPRVRTETVKFSLPEDKDLSRPESLTYIGAELIKSIANEQLTPEQGKAVVDVLAYQLKAIELQEIEARITSIEHTLNQRGTKS